MECVDYDEIALGLSGLLAWSGGQRLQSAEHLARVERVCGNEMRNAGRWS